MRGDPAGIAGVGCCQRDVRNIVGVFDQPSSMNRNATEASPACMKASDLDVPPNRSVRNLENSQEFSSPSADSQSPALSQFAQRESGRSIPPDRHRVASDVVFRSSGMSPRIDCQRRQSAAESRTTIDDGTARAVNPVA
jgi:hypothetical protein